MQLLSVCARGNYYIGALGDSAERKFQLHSHGAERLQLISFREPPAMRQNLLLAFCFFSHSLTACFRELTGVLM
jgi:hypothetical protein